MSASLMAVFFAFGNAMGSSTFGLLVRRGERFANATTGVLIGLLVNLPIMGAAAWYFWDPAWWNPWGILCFAIDGVLGPPVGRVLMFLSIQRLGLARTAPLMSTLPLAASLLGIAFLGERPGLPILAGTLLVAAGCAAITSRRGGGGGWDRRNLWLPFAAVGAFALGHLFRKVGLGLIPSPLFGLTMLSLTGALFLYPLGQLLPEAHRPRPGRWRAWPFYALVGLVNTVAVGCHFTALRYGDLSVVAPLTSTGPFFSLLLSGLFLRDLERVTPWLVAGTSLVVLGGGIITWRAL
ncbi:MAG: DMT family transporter [Candidatus Tectomicrobia bacterium]|uniref:DMT family transporter n=1 Tax=Tectimicrobiota bacterium TaxID=2528274 RepID=A0A932HUZ0_UNCTE|nr:DMT family transporter [Candidatus Tectomicrobia bacterium]